MAVLGLEPGVGFLVDRVEVLAGAGALADAAVDVGNEVARPLDLVSL